MFESFKTYQNRQINEKSVKLPITNFDCFEFNFFFSLIFLTTCMELWWCDICKKSLDLIRKKFTFQKVLITTYDKHGIHKWKNLEAAKRIFNCERTTILGMESMSH